MFKRTAYELKNGSRRTVLPTRELAESLKQASPSEWRYARISTVQVSWLRPGFGQVESFTPTTRSKSSTSTVAPSTETSTNATVAKPKRGRPTNASRLAGVQAQPAERALRGIAPANTTESSVPSVATVASATVA